MSQVSYYIQNADFLVCDSKTIEKYIHKEYAKYNPKTTFIAYGADTTKSVLKDTDKKVKDWYSLHHVKLNKYFLVVGRFVPENNFETIIREFMKSDVENDLVIVTNVEKNKFYDSLKQKTHFGEDERIKFVGTVYNQQLLKFIRENALAYIHGHSVGGTNPSLLEALASTKVNLLYDVGFNKEVGGDYAIYWNLTKGSLATSLKKAEVFYGKNISENNHLKKYIDEKYSWDLIIKLYEQLLI